VRVRILIGDCREKLRELPDASVNCCVTSPPYFGLRDYGVDGQMGLEPTPEEFVAGMVGVFREVRRVLRDDGTLWLNIGDSYANDGKWGGATGGKHATALHGNSGIGRRKLQTGLKSKDLVGIPWMLAFALRDDGWFLRQECIWFKPNAMPEPVKDRCTKAHESLFLLSKSQSYYFDVEAIEEPATYPTGAGNKTPYRVANERPGENANLGGSLHKIGPRDKRRKRSVWPVNTRPLKEAHFATFPPELIEPCILASSPARGIVLDPFAGAGTTGLVASRTQRDAILIELNQEYAEIARNRIAKEAGLFGDVLAP
jgi:DNA modification methylase